MNTYTQKAETAQRVANNNAANLMDTSLQNASLQRKADLMGNVVQCNGDFDAGIGESWHIHGEHVKHKNGKSVSTNQEYGHIIERLREVYPFFANMIINDSYWTDVNDWLWDNCRHGPNDQKI